MATVQNPTQQRLVLYGVSWEEYGRTLRALAERPSLRLTYDRGALEFMTLSLEHESLARFFNLLILALTLELALPLKGGGSTTFRRRRRQRGLEPDECYWIASEPLVRDKAKIDLRRDPPPDLALEVDISYSTLNRIVSMPPCECLRCGVTMGLLSLFMLLEQMAAIPWLHKAPQCPKSLQQT
jgi:Uma2 family endonuclease